MMGLSPKPRSRTYASPAIYCRIALEALLSRTYRGSEHLGHLEARFAARHGTAHALCLAQGRLGIYLALTQLIRPGQEVILSPYTIYDVVNMVLAAAGVPVFADVDPATGNLSPRAVRECLTARTGAVLATHIHGLSCEIEAIQTICRAAGVPLVEDCAQCLGGVVGGRPVGSFGDVGVFSFSRAKNINTIYGGMAVTSNADLHRRMQQHVEGYAFERRSRLWRRAASTALLDALTAPLVFQGLVFPLVRFDARRGSGLVDRITGAESGIQKRTSLPDHYARRMTPMQARLALWQLKELDAQTKRRIAHARLYHDGLADLPWLQLPPFSDDGRHTYLSFPVQSEQRDDLFVFLLERGRDVRRQYYHNLADTCAFDEFRRPCPEASSVAARTLLLPIYPDYPVLEIGRTIDAIRAFGSRRGTPAAARHPAGAASANPA